MVTFRNFQSLAAVTVPLVAGAPNPGEVDVNLTITPVTPKVTTSGPLTLSILASDATIPPKIVSVQGKRQGIVLTFNKPMNPVAASNVKNYALNWTSSHSKYAALGSFAYFISGAMGQSVSSGSVQLQSARYDPATNSVTLTTKQEIHYSTRTTLYVVVGQSDVPGGQSATTTVRRVQKSNPGPDLTDLEGNPIGSVPGVTPGYFSYTVSQGFQPIA